MACDNCGRRYCTCELQRIEAIEKRALENQAYLVQEQVLEQKREKLRLDRLYQHSISCKKYFNDLEPDYACEFKSHDFTVLKTKHYIHYYSKHFEIKLTKNSLFVRIFPEDPDLCEIIGNINSHNLKDSKYNGDFYEIEAIFDHLKELEYERIYENKEFTKIK